MYAISVCTMSADRHEHTDGCQAAKGPKLANLSQLISDVWGNFRSVDYAIKSREEQHTALGGHIFHVQTRQ